MINKTNFMPRNTLEYPSTYYRFDNKNYSPEAWSKKMYNEGFQRAETAAGVVSWSRTVSPFQPLPKSSSYASMAIFPAGSTRGSAATKAPLDHLSARALRLNAHSSSPGIPKNIQPPQAPQSKKTGIHTLQGSLQSTALQQSHFQGKGRRLGDAADPLLERSAARCIGNNPSRKPLESKKTGIHTLQGPPQSTALQQSHFTLFQGKENRSRHTSSPVGVLNEAKARAWEQQSNKVYQMISQTSAFELLRQKNSLSEKIAAEDYLSVSCLIKKLATLAPKSAVAIQQRYEKLRQQAEHKIKTAQEIAQEALGINPLFLENLRKTEEFMVASPGRPAAVYVNYREEQAMLAQECLARRPSKDRRNGL